MTERAGGDSTIGYNESWYYATAKGIGDYPALNDKIIADVCIVGAGYTGLSAAIHLAKRGYSVVVLEAHRVGSGASGRNGGVLGMGQRKDQEELESWLGRDDARHMWQIACDANQLVRDLIDEFDIECDLTNGYMAVAHKPSHVQSMWDYCEHLARYYDCEGYQPVTAAEVHDMMGVDTYHGGYVNQLAGHIHPLNLALGMSRAAQGLGTQLFEHSRVTHYEAKGEKVVVATADGLVEANYLLIGCNGYLGRLDKEAEKYQMPINNFILATEPLGAERATQINRDNLAIVDTRFVVNYWHNSPDHRLIFGGGENYSSRFPRDIAQFVRKYMLEVYPNLKDVNIEYGWGGTLAITMRRMPHFGRKAHNIYWAQGYSGHGIHMATMGGKMAADAIMGQAERFDLFASLKHYPFPGGRWLRWPGLVAGMLYYSLLDHL